MQLICAIVGHQLSPFRRLRGGGNAAHCLVCQRPLAPSPDGGWALADEGPEAAPPSR